MKTFWEEFKKPIVIVFIIFLGLALYTKLFGPIPFYINSVNTTKTDLFSASGQGKATAVPDTATISLGVTKQAAQVLDAQNQVNKTSEKIISDLKALGISEKDIKTTNYSVNPNYNPVPLGIVRPDGSANGYEVTQNLEVKIKPIENVNKAIDAATADGANLVGGVNFTFSDSLQKDLEKQATQTAVDTAKENAKSLANAAGVRLGKIINVISSTNNAPPIYPLSAQAKSADETTAPTQVTPGENTVQIGVTIYYETY